MRPIVVPSTVRGVPGPRGPAGLVLIQHGDDPDVPRPDTEEIILWRGSVAPNNWDTSKDLWVRDTSTT
jgi:hypothetical protein